MNHELVALGLKSPIIKTSKFPKKLLCLCLIIFNLVSMNGNIRLPINDISSNINNFNCIYCFTKTLCLSSLSDIKSLIDLFNGIDYPKCSVDPLILSTIFLIYSIF
jgi:hypothetical protein